MKTLSEIKEEVYKEYNVQYECDMYEYVIDEIAQRYATEYAKEALKLASETSRVMVKNTDDGHVIEVLSWTDSDNFKFSVSKQSILSETNLPKHR